MLELEAVTKFSKVLNAFKKYKKRWRVEKRCDIAHFILLEAMNLQVKFDLNRIPFHFFPSPNGEVKREKRKKRRCNRLHFILPGNMNLLPEFGLDSIIFLPSPAEKVEDERKERRWYQRPFFGGLNLHAKIWPRSDYSTFSPFY